MLCAGNVLGVIACEPDAAETPSEVVVGSVGVLVLQDKLGVRVVLDQSIGRAGEARIADVFDHVARILAVGSGCGARRGTGCLCCESLRRHAHLHHLLKRVLRLGPVGQRDLPLEMLLSAGVVGVEGSAHVCVWSVSGSAREWDGMRWDEMG